MMRSAARLLHPAITKAHHIALFQAGQRPDPLVKRPQDFKDGKPVFTQDTRPTRIRPFLQGAFEKWFPYKLDAVFYQDMEVKAREYKFELQLVPTAEVAVVTRWLKHWVDDPKRPRTMEDPTFDKVLDLINSFGEVPAETQEVKESGQ